MKSKIWRTGVFAVTAALFVGLTGTVQAIPISGRNNPGARAVAAHAVAKNYSAALASLNIIPAIPVIPTTFLLSGSATALHFGRHQPIKFMPPPIITQPVTHPVITPTAPLPTFTPVGQIPVPRITVPDGGMTAMMLGGVFYGLVSLRKKLAAGSGI